MLWHRIIQMSPGCKLKRYWQRNGIHLCLSPSRLRSASSVKLLSKLALTFHMSLPLSKPSIFLYWALSPPSLSFWSVHAFPNSFCSASVHRVGPSSSLELHSLPRTHSIHNNSEDTSDKCIRWARLYIMNFWSEFVGCEGIAVWLESSKSGCKKTAKIRYFY